MLFATCMDATSFAGSLLLATCFAALQSVSDTAGSGQPAGVTVAGSAALSPEELQLRLERLERRNSELEAQLGEIKLEQEGQWLTKERAKEIRAIVQDVVADANSRIAMQTDSVTAGWNDGFYLQSADGRFRLEAGGMVQARFVWSSIRSGLTYEPGPDQYSTDQVNNRQGFDHNNSEIWLGGHVLSPDIQYQLKGRFANNDSAYFVNSGTNYIGENSSGLMTMLDAWIKVQLDEQWSFRAGQFRNPFAREFLVLEQYQMAVNRSILAYHMGLGYTEGFEFEFVDDEIRWRGSINDGANDVLSNQLETFGTVAQNSSWGRSGTEFAATTRFEWKPFGGWKQFQSFTSPIGDSQGLLVGAALMGQTGTPSDAPDDNTTARNSVMGATADVTWFFGGASIFVAGYYMSVESNAAQFVDNFTTDPYVAMGRVQEVGIEAQAAVYLMPKWELFGRLEWGRFSSTDHPSLTAEQVAFNDQQALLNLTMGVNWYIDGQDLKFTTDFGYGFYSIVPALADDNAGWRPASADQVVLRAQLQLLF